MTSDRVHTLSDLANWQFEGTALAVLGHPVAHSLSPPMHNAALAELARVDARFTRWRYFKFEVDPAKLLEALPQFHAAGFLGLNLTIPHKTIALAAVAPIDPIAAEIGAVNTLRRTATGFEGFNTDGYGISRAVHEDLGTSLAGTDVVLLGAGGAARAAAVTCLRERCVSLWIGNRTAANLQELLEQLRPLAGNIGVPLHSFDLAAPKLLPASPLVINATSAGLKPGEPPPIDLQNIPGTPRVYDMIYNPPETALLRAARARGLPAANGLSMLAHQGARALEIWTGQRVSAATMRQACLAALPPSARS